MNNPSRQRTLPLPASIGEVAEEFGVSQRALRFYEERGLIRPTRDGRHRFYTAEDVDRIRTIVKLKSFGFSLMEITGILAAPGDGPFGLSEVRIKDQVALLRQQLISIRVAIFELEQL